MGFSWRFGDSCVGYEYCVSGGEGGRLTLGFLFVISIGICFI